MISRSGEVIFRLIKGMIYVNLTVPIRVVDAIHIKSMILGNFSQPFYLATPWPAFFPMRKIDFHMFLNGGILNRPGNFGDSSVFARDFGKIIPNVFRALFVFADSKLAKTNK